jgi:phenylalanyl-tRNA synthetase beta chain
MRFPLSWLRDYVAFDLGPDALAERLTLLGMEVKGIEPWGGDWRNVVVGELLSVEKHPRADRLFVTTLNIGDGEPLAIVCGATNIAAGQRVPVALPGAVLPGERPIERTEKMGVASNGMLCSGDELHLTGDAEGILILPADAPIGTTLIDLYGDTVLDVDVKPNRGDALSLIGLAREVAASTGSEVRWPEIEPVETGPSVEDRLAVEVLARDLCPRFVGRYVDGVTVGPSPDRVQMRLLSAGVRPISNVVDASNFVMVELGKPIHTYDADGVGERDGRRQLIVRRAEAGERLQTLDHLERTLDPETLLIADDRGPLGIAGIMGGAASEVSERTKRVIIESAIFDPITIRRSGQRYGLRSEASLRFEKGVEFRLARIGADRTARLIAEWAGGMVARGRVDSAPDEPSPSRVAFRPSRVNRLLGTDLPIDEQGAVLARVGVAIEETSGDRTVSVPVAGEPKPLSVTVDATAAMVAVVPTWRRDITVEADVAEEVARIHGYERVPGNLPHTPMPAYRRQPLELRDRVRETLAGAGLTEVVSHALVSPRLAERFTWETPLPSVDGGSRAGGRAIHVTNPLSADHSVLRPTVVGSLVEIAAANIRRGHGDLAIFEIGKGYGQDGDETREWWRLAVAACGAADEPAWNRPARAYDLDDAKGAIELVCRRLGIAAPIYEPLGGAPLLHPGRAARVAAERDGRLALAGVVGELHPIVAEEWELRGARLVVAELDVAGLADGELRPVRAVAPSRHPMAERDLAIIVPESMLAATIADAIRENTGPELVSLALFDVYRGAPLASDEKSLAWRLAFQSTDRTLTDAEIDAALTVVVRAIAAVGGRVRT